MNVARLLLTATMRFRVSEENALRMTPRKFFRLFDEYLYMTGVKKEPPSIDDLP